MTSLPAPATASSPGRVNLIGEHVDYQQGLCLPIALRERTTARLVPREDDRIVVNSGRAHWKGTVADLVPGAVTGWAAYVAGTLGALGVTAGLDLDVESDVPLGSGLSSSAALICAVALAANESFGFGLTREQLLPVTLRAESEFVGAPTGGLDQTASLLCEPRHALLIDFADGSRSQVPFEPDAHGLALLVINTRVSHQHADGGYGNRRAECERAASLLGVGYLRELDDPAAGAALPAPLDRRVHHVVSEIGRVRDFVAALRAGDWSAAGSLMLASHASLRDDFEVSCAELDITVEIVTASGALGARMTGGGFGGSAIALVPADRVDDARAAVAAAYADRGWRSPDFLLA